MPNEFHDVVVENYDKGEVKELDNALPSWFPAGAVCMVVNTGSKIRNLMSFALNKMKGSDSKQIVWTGCGSAISKTISCAEIMKRQVKDLHQVTDIHFKRIEEYWEPKLAGLERLKVNRDVPVISILLSKDPLDPSLPGYQAPNVESQCFAGVQSPSSSSLPGKKSASKKKQTYGGVQPSSRSPAMAADFPLLETRRDKSQQNNFKPRNTKGSQRPPKPATAGVDQSTGTADSSSSRTAAAAVAVDRDEQSEVMT